MEEKNIEKEEKDQKVNELEVNLKYVQSLDAFRIKRTDTAEQFISDFFAKFDEEKTPNIIEAYQERYDMMCSIYDEQNIKEFYPSPNIFIKFNPAYLDKLSIRNKFLMMKNFCPELKMRNAKIKINYPDEEVYAKYEMLKNARNETKKRAQSILEQSPDIDSFLTLVKKYQEELVIVYPYILSYKTLLINVKHFMIYSIKMHNLSIFLYVLKINNNMIPPYYNNMTFYIFRDLMKNEYYNIATTLLSNVNCSQEGKSSTIKKCKEYLFSKKKTNTSEFNFWIKWLDLL